MGDLGGLPLGSLVELFCTCGASQQVPADRVESGDLPPCRNCGGPLQADTPLPADAEVPDSAVPLPPLSFGAELFRTTDGGDVRCPACGRPCKAALRGPEGRDRILACGSCGTKVDLPEAPGFARERFTRWESMGGEEAKPATSRPVDGPDDIGARIAVTESFEVNGRRFDSREVLERHVRDTLPEDAVARTRSKISGAQGGGRSVSTQVEEIESTSALAGARRARRPARRRPIFRGLLARIRKLFG